MKDGGGARAERLERTFLFLYYRFGKKKGIFIEVAQKRGGSIGVAGREWRLNTNGLLRFPCNRVSTCLDVWPTPDEEEEEGEREEEGEGRKEACPREFAAIVPAIFPSHSNGLYTRTHTRTFRAREHLADDAEPSRADANVFTATAYSNSWKKNNREKERKKEFVPGFYSERGRVIACRSVIAKLPPTDFRDRFDRYRPT